MSGAMSLRFSTQAQTNFRRITDELADLHRQVASGAKADDLKGFGGGSARLITAQSLKAAADARGNVIGQLDARLGVQGVALAQAANSAGLLAIAIRDAVSANDGRGINVELDITFTSIVGALNETWNGQPLFAGERQDGRPIKVGTLAELQAAAGPLDIFDEAVRRQTIDLGSGAPIELSAKASEISQGLLGTLADLKDLLDGAGGAIGQPISGAQVTQLLAFASQLEAGGATITAEEGRIGQLQKRFEDERTRLQARSDLLTKEVGEQIDANLAEVSVRLSALMVQYQAAAKTFGDLSNLSLLDYL
jgi:flagellar hook-associated protein 3 FlgL